MEVCVEYAPPSSGLPGCSALQTAASVSFTLCPHYPALCWGNLTLQLGTCPVGLR